METGKVAATKTFRMALTDQEKAKGISNSLNSYSLASVSRGLQAPMAFAHLPEPVRRTRAS